MYRFIALSISLIFLSAGSVFGFTQLRSSNEPPSITIQNATTFNKQASTVSQCLQQGQSQCNGQDLSGSYHFPASQATPQSNSDSTPPTTQAPPPSQNTTSSESTNNLTNPDTNTQQSAANPDGSATLLDTNPSANQAQSTQSQNQSTSFVIS